MKKIGITGGIGSGKTTVCMIFELLGIPVYYADDRAKLLMNKDPKIILAIKDLLGTESYKDGRLNRPWIANQVFNDTDKLARLNQIVHPAVGKDAEKWFSEQNSKYALKEAALLVENGSYKKLDKLISVSAPKPIRIERVMQRDNSDLESVTARIENQFPQEEKDAVADFVIINDGESSLINQVLGIHKKIIDV